MSHRYNEMPTYTRGGTDNVYFVADYGKMADDEITIS